MKSRILIVLLAGLAIAVLAGSAFAGAGESSGFYLQLKGGYHWMDGDGDFSETDADANATNSGSLDDDGGFVIGGAVGYDWSEMGVNLRSELEYLYYSDVDWDLNDTNGTVANSIKANADIDISTLLLNVYYDFETETGWVPYIGAGAGLAFIDCDVDFDMAAAGITAEDDSADATNFAFQAGLGVAYEFNANWALDLGLRYSYFGEPDGIENNEVKVDWDDFNTFETLLGVRYTF